MTDELGMCYPRLAEQLPKSAIADLPTPLEQHSLSANSSAASILVKRDDLTSKLYGGNKIRKLEYLLRRAQDRNARRVATFGTVASNHALATALFATAHNLECTCLLSHQSKTPKAPIALNMHLRNHTEIVRYGGSRSSRVRTMRKYLQYRQTWVIPMGGSNWLGAVAFVNAALELCAQLEDASLPVPDRVYVANGTMGTAAGLALGFALAEMPTEVHAVRVTHDFVANPPAMQRLIAKTALMMRRLDATIPADIAGRSRIIFREGFFAGGYAHTNAETDAAINTAKAELGLSLDTTYSGKAMAALLHDLALPELAGKHVLFWNTHNSRVLPVSAEQPDDTSALPDEFLRYYV
jgi:1-aminocyclopropane-1-carboxylate deaminase/D-cysteine desulfhydrase-like pyridoxal-dependent ACC family enzyme